MATDEECSKYKRIEKHPIVFTALVPKVFSILEEVLQLFSLRAVFNPASHEGSARFMQIHSLLTA